MGFLDCFELIESDNEGKSKPFITVRDTSVTFSKQAIECLEYAAFVHMYWDKNGRRFAVKACEEDEVSYEFYRKPKEGRSMLVRISGKKLTSKVLELAGITKTDNGLRYYGEYIEDEKVLSFDMSIPGVHVER